MAELAAVFALCFARLFPFSIQVFLLAFTSLSLWLRGLSWRDVGLRRSKGWWKVVLQAVLAALLIAIVVNLVTAPLVHRLVGSSVNNSRFENIRGNFVALMGWLAVAWTLAAFGEEMIFRGYLMNRVADIVGRTRTGWVISLLLSSLIFGLGHGYQGVAGVIDTATIGLLLGTLYLVSKRNLWVNIICHGVIDSISLIALYFSRAG
ncbi:MAG TPA: CPBP family intramembrane glutamic endopeptidase [Pyrinomonadaceae bacterium]|nr:CPBP family intramembrane glutamic endopeptidase [Pyrinomonadaceae bacterium]